MNAAISAPIRFLKTAIDPVTILLLLGLVGFYQYYWPRFLVFVAVALTLFGIWAVFEKHWEIAIPIQTFFLGTWAYNVFIGKSFALVSLMVIFFLLLSYGFWTLLGRPPIKSLNRIHGLYLVLATLVVWELAILIQLFWSVEPWSRMFLVVAALIFLELALSVRLSGTTNFHSLWGPLGVVLLLAGLVIASTPIPGI